MTGANEPADSPAPNSPNTADPAPPDRDPNLYARSFVDVYDRWYEDLHDVNEIVDAFLARLAPPALILELGAGTGRLTGPLIGAGYQVVALDSSVPMLRLDPSTSLRTAGDMAAAPFAPSSCDATLIAYNTIFNLPSTALQQACLGDTAATLQSGGLLAIEAFIAPPVDPDAPFGLSVVPHHTHSDKRMAIMTWQQDSETITGAHIELGPAGSHTRPWQLCYQSPAELDALATAAGLELVERCADWAGTTFDPTGVRHVSWYRRL